MHTDLKNKILLQHVRFSIKEYAITLGGLIIFKPKN